MRNDTYTAYQPSAPARTEDPVTNYVNSYSKFPTIPNIKDEVRMLPKPYHSAAGQLTANKHYVDMALENNPNEAIHAARRKYRSEMQQLEVKRSDLEKTRAQLRVEQQGENEQLELLSDKKNETVQKLNLVDSQQDDFSRHLKDLQEKNDIMTSELRAVQDEESKLQESVEKLARRKEELARQMTDVAAEHHSQQVRLVQVSARHMKLTDANDNLQADSCNYRAQLDDLQRTRDKLTERFQQLESEEASHNSTVKQLDNERDRLNQELNATNEELTRLDELVKNLPSPVDYQLDLAKPRAEPLAPVPPVMSPCKKNICVPRTNPFPSTYIPPPRCQPQPIYMPHVSRGLHKEERPATVPAKGPPSPEVYKQPFQGGHAPLSPPPSGNHGMISEYRGLKSTLARTPTQFNSMNVYGMPGSRPSTGLRSHNATYERSFGRKL